MNNRMKLQFLAHSENESFARIAVASFISQIDPTVEELDEIKTVVSEAVTNAIIHGYDQQEEGWVRIEVSISAGEVKIIVEDDGVGIGNLEEARQPLYTTKPEMERSGMGFTIIENFMDHVEIQSRLGVGTRITMTKRLQTDPVVH
jgi:stage II sporulation protein AB (anti-sigma F factor)